MEKSKLGISVGLLGAIFFFVGFFSGFLATVIVGGYILIREESFWLRRTAIKGIILMLLFAILSGVLNLIPEAISLVQDALRIANVNLTVPVVHNVFYLLQAILSYGEKILFLLLGFMALKQRTIVIPPIEKLISHYMD